MIFLFSRYIAVLASATFFVCVVSIILILIKKITTINKDQVIPLVNPNQVNNFNTEKRNKALASVGQYALVGLFYALGILPQILIPLEKVMDNPWLTLPRHFTLPFINAIFIPCLFYVNNKSARKFLAEILLKIRQA